MLQQLTLYKKEPRPDIEDPRAGPSGGARHY